MSIFAEHKRLDSSRILNGDYTRDELIENFIPLALKIAGRFPSKYLETDEARGIALVELICLLDKAEKPIQNVGKLVGYISMSLKYRLKDYCQQHSSQSVISTPRSVDKRVLTHSFAEDLGAAYYTAAINSPESRAEFIEVLLKVCGHPRERVIIMLLLEGDHTLIEIGEELGISRQRVQQLRDILFEKIRVELK